MEDNMEIFKRCQEVPEEAKKEIQAGRLKGFTDINPMWRIRILTEMFGPCGYGWWYVIKDKHIESGASGELCAIVDIDLFYKYNGEVSQPIPGTGGSLFVASERNGLRTSDEAFKMALTDAISVSAKAIGVGADVYWEKGRDKYNELPEDERPKNKTKEQPNADTALQNKKKAPAEPEPDENGNYICTNCHEVIEPWVSKQTGLVKMQPIGIARNSLREYKKVLCLSCINKLQSAKEGGNANA